MDTGGVEVEEEGVEVDDGALKVVEDALEVDPHAAEAVDGAAEVVSQGAGVVDGGAEVVEGALEVDTGAMSIAPRFVSTFFFSGSLLFWWNAAVPRCFRWNTLPRQPGGRKKIARRFIAGSEVRAGRSPAGTTELWADTIRRKPPFYRPRGTLAWVWCACPAMNRRAILARPSGTCPNHRSQRLGSTHRDTLPFIPPETTKNLFSKGHPSRADKPPDS